MDGLLIIPILAFLVLIHEFGHFITARSVGVTVEEFGIGIPPRIKGWRWRGVLWSINAIPFGGFVRVLGEDGKSMAPGSMNTKGPWQRAFFLAAGAGMNFLVAILLIVLLVGTQGQSQTHVYIDRVLPDTPAAKAGWQAGDRFVAVAGQKVTGADILVHTTTDHAGAPMSVVVERDGKRIQTTVVPREHPPSGQGATGVAIQEPLAATFSAQGVTPNGPADKAGWLPGDKIVSIAGHPVTDAFSLSFDLEQAAGSTVPVVINRDGKEQTTHLAVPPLSQTITSVQQGSAADKAGWQIGDTIASVNGARITNALGLVTALEQVSGTTVPAVVHRDGKDIQTRLAVPKVGEDADVATAIGVGVASQGPTAAIGFDPKGHATYKPVPAAEVIPKGLGQAYDTTASMLRGLKDIATGSAPLNQVAGPIGMGQLVNEAVKVSPTPIWVTLTNITIVLSLNLAVLNLLPLPALDGGRLFFVLIELLRGGRRIAPEKEGVVHFVGIVLLLALMFVVAFFDVNRIFDGRSFLP